MQLRYGCASLAGQGGQSLQRCPGLRAKALDDTTLNVNVDFFF